LFALVFAATAAAQDLINADRPGIADGSTTLKARTWQIEIGAERDDRTAEEDILWPTLIRYGVTNDFELRIESSVYQRIEGWAPVSIGAKYHFHDAPSLGVIGRAFIVNTDEVTADLRLANDFEIGEKWAINPNVGIAVLSDGEHFLAGLAALTVQYNVTDRAGVFVDGGLTAPEARHGEAAILLDLGGAWIFRPNMQLDASIGWGAHGETVPGVFWSAGISRRF